MAFLGSIFQKFSVGTCPRTPLRCLTPSALVCMTTHTTLASPLHAITHRLFSKDVYSVPLRALRLRVCVRLDRGGGGGGEGLPKCFQMYKNLHKFKCTGNLPEIPHEQLSWCCTPPPPVSFKQTLSDLFHLPKYCASYSRAFCCCHALAWFKFTNFYYIKYSVL